MLSRREILLLNAQEGRRRYGTLGNSYPGSFFKRPESMARAELVGIEDMEDDDLTPEGLRAKRQAIDEGNNTGHGLFFRGRHNAEGMCECAHAYGKHTNKNYGTLSCSMCNCMGYRHSIKNDEKTVVEKSQEKSMADRAMTGYSVGSY